MNVATIFFGSDTKLRSGWRFLIFCFGFVITGTAISFPVAKYLSGFSGDSYLFNFGLLTVSELLTLVLVIVLGWLCGKYLENIPFRALGAWFTRGWIGHLLLGLATGAITLLLAVFIGYAHGGLRFQVNEFPYSARIIGGLSISFIVLAVAAAAEEALFRGYILQTFSRSDLAWLAIVLTSLAFGMAHLKNQNASAISTANTVIAGIWFGIAYLKTRDLWFVWGMHFIWNWMQGSIFGIEISGYTNLSSVSLFREIDTGPAWLTGETYGIEGGLITTVALIASTAVIYYSPFLKPDEEMLALTSSKLSRTRQAPPAIKPSVS